MKATIEKSVYFLETLEDNKRQGVISGKIEAATGGESSYTTIGRKSVSEFVSKFSGKKVWCIWVISNEFITPEKAMMMGVERAIGMARYDMGDRYSDLTGYLWTDDEGKIGGHDLTHVMSCHAGKFGFIVIREAQIDLEKITFDES